MVPDVTVGTRARGADGPRLGRKPFEAARGEHVAVKLATAAVVMPDEERARIRVPVREGLARKVEVDDGLASGGCVEDERAREAFALVQHEQPLVARDRRPARDLEALPRAVPQLRQSGARGVKDPERGVAGVAVLAVRDRDERLVAREAGDVRVLRVRVDPPWPGAVAEHEDGRPFAVARAPEDAEGSSDREASAVRRGEVGGDHRCHATRERLSTPVAQLVALRVVEPEDLLACRIGLRRDAVARPLRTIGEAATRAAPAIPRVDLELSALVGDVDDAIGRVAGPRREPEPRRAEPPTPRGFGRDARLRQRHRGRV